MPERIFSDPYGFVPIQANDCTGVIAKGAGGVDPLPVMQWGDGFSRVVYPLTPRLRKFIRNNEHVALTVVVKTGAGGLQEISARLHAVKLTRDN